MLILQDDACNQSDLATVVVAPLTSNLRYAQLPGNVLLKASSSGLDRDSVVNVTQMTTLDKSFVESRAGQLKRTAMDEVEHGVGLVLGL